MFILDSILTEGIAQLSYVVADTESGTAAVIDPRTDVEIYEKLARKHGVSITHIFETHIHADFVSGSRSLADRVGTANIYLSGVQANYDFDAQTVNDGQEFDFGSFTLTARHTPGHTPEHLSFLLCEAKHASQAITIVHTAAASASTFACSALKRWLGRVVSRMRFASFVRMFASGALSNVVPTITTIAKSAPKRAVIA